MSIYVILVILAVFLGLIGTVFVAVNPEDKYYGSTKKRFTNLGIIYIVATIVSILLMLVFVFH